MPDGCSAWAQQIVCLLHAIDMWLCGTAVNFIEPRQPPAGAKIYSASELCSSPVDHICRQTAPDMFHWATRRPPSALASPNA